MVSQARPDRGAGQSAAGGARQGDRYFGEYDAGWGSMLVEELSLREGRGAPAGHLGRGKPR